MEAGDGDRKVLIDMMLEARTEREVEAAENWFLASAVSLITVGPVAELVGGLLYDSSGGNVWRDGER